jgi:DNA-binding response OmpR family regulator
MEQDTLSRTVLVLEEEQELRDDIEALLRRDGYRVITAREKEEAFLRTQSERPDLILAGVSGSESDTIAKARQTRERISSEDTPIVIFSASSIPEGAEKEISDRIHLIQPEHFDQLRALLRRILRR